MGGRAGWGSADAVGGAGAVRGGPVWDEEVGLQGGIRDCFLVPSAARALLVSYRRGAALLRCMLVGVQVRGHGHPSHGGGTGIEE